MSNGFSKDTENRYQQVVQDLQEVADNATDNIISFNLLQPVWQYLEDSETLLIDLIRGKHPDSETENGSMEFGGVLYMVNTYLAATTDPFLKRVREVLIALGLPGSKMKPSDITSLENEALFGPGIVAGDGTLYSDIKFGQLDPGWVLAMMKYVHYLIFKRQKATFGTTPLTPANQKDNKVFDIIANKESLTIAVFGDWGTGPWADGVFHSPAQLVAAGINKFSPDISFHLGDVYYAGIGDEENDALLPDVPEDYSGFPQGKLLNFTLNSNHEAYDGSNGYFNVALKNPLFAIQNNTSYFAFTFKDWLIVGLDSAYYDESFFVMKGGINQAQVDFITGLNPSANQKVLLLTHHTALATNGKTINNHLYPDVYGAFGQKGPDYWYYGHTHNAIVYNDNSATNEMSIGKNKFTKIRCTGSAAIPFGNGYELSTDGKTPANTIDYFAHTPMPNADDRQARRVLNGFALITLTKDSISETFYEVHADGDKVSVVPAYSIPITMPVD